MSDSPAIRQAKKDAQRVRARQTLYLRAEKIAKLAITHAFGRTWPQCADFIGASTKSAEKYRYDEYGRNLLVAIEELVTKLLLEREKPQEPVPEVPTLTLEPIDNNTYDKDEAARRLIQVIEWASKTGDSQLVMRAFDNLHKLKGLTAGQLGRPSKDPKRPEASRLVPSPVARIIDARSKREGSDEPN